MRTASNDLGTAPNGDPWQLDLRNDGDGWTGTFAGIIAMTVEAIVENGIDNDCDWFAEVTLSDGTVRYGKLAEWMGEDVFRIADELNGLNGLPMIIECDDVRRFRA